MQLSHNQLEKTWKTNRRWQGITRPYSAQDVDRLRGTIHIEYSLARLGAERLWDLVHDESYVAALGALTGNQAVKRMRKSRLMIHFCLSCNQ